MHHVMHPSSRAVLRQMTNSHLRLGGKASFQRASSTGGEDQTYDPLTGLFSPEGDTPAVATVTVDAIEIAGDPDMYAQMTASDASMRLIDPVTIKIGSDYEPQPGDTLLWKRREYTVKRVQPLGPSDVPDSYNVIASR